MDTSRAHVARLGAESFLNSIERFGNNADDYSSQQQNSCLEHLAQLFMLEEVASHAGFHVSEGHISKYESHHGIVRRLREGSG